MVQNRLVPVLKINFLKAYKEKFQCMEPEPPVFAWSRPWPSGAGAGPKSDGSATLQFCFMTLSVGGHILISYADSYKYYIEYIPVSIMSVTVP